MRKYSLLSIAVFILGFIFCSCPASANMYVPSIVELITAPTIWSIYVITLIVTIPIILIISSIETLIIKKSCIGSFKRLLLDMFIINCITSLARVPVFGWSILWPGLLISYVLTILFEAVLITGMLYLKTGSKKFRSFLLLSIKMNTASYAFLAIILASMIYIPYISSNNVEVRKALSGNLLLIDCTTYKTFNINNNKFISEKNNCMNSRLQCFSIASHNSFVGVDEECNIKKLKLNPNGIISASIIGHVKQFKKNLAISKDARLILCNLDNKLAVYDCKTHKILLKIPSLFDSYKTSQFGDGFVLITGENKNANKAVIVTLKDGKVRQMKNVSSYHPVLSPDSKDIAWQQGKTIWILNLENGNTKKFSVPVSFDHNNESNIYNDTLAWSQDGQFIVYIGTANQFLQGSFRYDLIVVNKKNGQYTTLCKYVWMRPSTSNLLWL